MLIKFVISQKLPVPRRLLSSEVMGQVAEEHGGKVLERNELAVLVEMEEADADRLQESRTDLMVVRYSILKVLAMHQARTEGRL